MRRGTPARIRVNGRDLQATYLGAGHFATAYRVGATVYVYVRGDYMKEAAQGLRQAHLPEIECIEHIDTPDGSFGAVYRMPYYEPLRAKEHPAAWADYRALEAAREEAFGEMIRAGRRLEFHGLDLLDRVIADARVNRKLRSALETLRARACNYGCGVTVEFAPRNLGVDLRGRLVLRDVLFDAEALSREMEQKRRRALGRAALW